MDHILFPEFDPSAQHVVSAYRRYLEEWLGEMYEEIQNGDIALSQCVFAFLAEQLLYHENKLPWDTLLADYLTDENGNPLAYSEQYGSRLFGYTGQWKQTPIHAIYNHHWILSHYGADAEPYARLVLDHIQSSGWIYNPSVSPTNLRNRMRSELMVNMAMGCQVLHAAGLLDSVREQLKATVSSEPPTAYLAAEYFRFAALKTMDAENLFVTDCARLVSNCRLDVGFCDFNIADKIDDYMGTKKRVHRDHMVPSPMSTIYAVSLLPRLAEEEREEAVQAIDAYKALLTEQPFAIPAFKIRDIDIDFGPGVTVGEVIAATILLNHRFRTDCMVMHRLQQQTSLHIGETNRTCKMKKYIQPFERILATKEFNAVCGTCFDQKAEQRIPAEMDTQILIDRLAYWDRVEDGLEIPTKQALLEATYYSKVDECGNLVIERLPNTRILRYGVHDLHEYRGKFFPQLVKSLINIAKLPVGATVIDPFCGSGTTNVAAAAMGMNSLGIDLNPLSVKISRTKIALLNIPVKTLQSMTQIVIDEVCSNEGSASAELWDETERRYLERWFAPQALREIANILTTIRRHDNKALVDFWEVCLSNIIRTVSWQNEADLRIRKEVEEYAPGTAIHLFVEECQRQISRVVPYLKVLEQDQKITEHSILEGNTTQASEQFSDYVGKGDAIITSPPYATALPYLDTDRLSLLVLGLLKKDELKDRALDMIGNREVTESQRRELWNYYNARKSELPDSVVKTIDKIAKSNHGEGVGFRRKNLPALLGKYFLDMFDAMRSHVQLLRPGAYAFYVVGNNSTNIDGKRFVIETDKLLWDVAAAAGFVQEEFLSMELLHSRDVFKENSGTAESILCLRKEAKMKQEDRKAIFTDSTEILRDGAWDFAGENTLPYLHALHPYPARFIPQIPRKAIEAYTKPGQTVLDPFAGCGTTLLEGIVAGRNAIGVDNNAVACLISRAKTTAYQEEDYDALKELLARIQDEMLFEKIVPDIPTYRNIDYWFDEMAIQELGKLRAAIIPLPERARRLAMAVFSSIIVSVSYQDSDTRYSRKPYDYPAGKAVKMFQKKLLSSIKEARATVPLMKGQAIVFQRDSRRIDFIPSKSVQLIVTSPPYLNAYDYHKYHRHRLEWINGDVAMARDAEIGKHDTFTKKGATPDQYFADMGRCFAEWEKVLAEDGSIVLIIGDAIVSGKPVPTADIFISQLEKLRFSVVHRWIRKIDTTRKSFNQQARVDQEHVLLLKRKANG